MCAHLGGVSGMGVPGKASHRDGAWLNVLCGFAR